jgi:hypothetical protein
MADDTGAVDPFGAMLARAELDAVSESRAARAAAAADDGPTDIESGRIIGRVLVLAARKLGIAQAGGLDELLQLILARASSGGLDPPSYRIAWILAHARRRDAPSAS